MKHTIEQIEYLRKRANISYEEAVEVLELHDGDIARALVELEKRGKIKGSYNHSTTNGSDEFKSNAKKIYNNSISYRFLVKKDENIIVNLSLLYSAIALVVAPHLTLVSAFVAVVLGYKISIKKEEISKYDFDVKDTVDKATTTIKNAVKDFTEQSSVKNTESEDNSKESYNEVTIDN